MFENGTLLGLRCGSSFPSKSVPQSDQVPQSLHPTLLQLSTVHWQWIDRLPWADARDEVILQSGNIDEEELLWDVFHMETFTIRPGANFWDGTAYSIAPEFSEKWGYLFPSFWPAESVNNSSMSWDTSPEA